LKKLTGRTVADVHDKEGLKKAREEQIKEKVRRKTEPRRKGRTHLEVSSDLDVYKSGLDAIKAVKVCLTYKDPDAERACPWHPFFLRTWKSRWLQLSAEQADAVFGTAEAVAEAMSTETVVGTEVGMLLRRGARSRGRPT
jgi:hypothetical protein